MPSWMSFPLLLRAEWVSTLLLWHHGDCIIIPGPRVSLSATSLMPVCCDNTGPWVTHGIVSEVLLTQWWSVCRPKGWEADWQCWYVDSKHLPQGRFMSQWSAWDSEPRCQSRSARDKSGLVVKTRGHQAQNDNRIYRGVDMIVDQYQTWRTNSPGAFSFVYFTCYWQGCVDAIVFSWLINHVGPSYISISIIIQHLYSQCPEN